MPTRQRKRLILLHQVRPWQGRALKVRSLVQLLCFQSQVQVVRDSVLVGRTRPMFTLKRSPMDHLIQHQAWLQCSQAHPRQAQALWQVMRGCKHCNILMHCQRSFSGNEHLQLSAQVDESSDSLPEIDSGTEAVE